jgi:GntR family transcriptional regulator, transcriptional repressor for pyruvate dehydrogenase complex
LARGERLPNERELAKGFGVSQPAIREAIRVLEVMGLVQVRHGSGAYVSANVQEFLSQSPQTLLQIEEVGILDVIELRLSLARYSTSRAVRYATDENFDLIEQFERALLEASVEDDFPRTSQAAMRFLAALSAAAHSPLLFALESFLIELMLALQIVAARGNPEEFDAHGRDWRKKFADDRLRLIRALRARDEAAALDATVAYLEEQSRLFGRFPELSGIRLVDPVAVRDGRGGPGGPRLPGTPDLHRLDIGGNAVAGPGRVINEYRRAA